MAHDSAVTLECTAFWGSCHMVSPKRKQRYFSVRTIGRAMTRVSACVSGCVCVCVVRVCVWVGGWVGGCGRRAFLSVPCQLELQHPVRTFLRNSFASALSMGKIGDLENALNCSVHNASGAMFQHVAIPCFIWFPGRPT